MRFLKLRLTPSGSLLFLCASLALLALAVAGNAEPAASPRQTLSLDAGWRFLKKDAPGAEQRDFKDGDWNTVDVPHDWSIEGPYDPKAPSGSGGGYLPTGVSWYRKSFTLPAASGERRVFIDFDGVMANSEVWINGHRLGQRPNGYIGFRYDLTPFLEQSKANIVSVKTDTAAQPDSRWYTGQGIYRHVRLVATDPVHVAQWGVCVTTPKVSDAQASVQVKTTVFNDATAAREVALQTILYGPDGREITKGTAAVRKIEPGKSVEFTQELAVAHPALWNLETPSIYRVVAKVVVGNQTMDETSQTFGIRRFEFKADTGFWLNGKNFKIQGVCLHHDGGAVGAAVPLRVWERRLEILRTLGVNAIRTSHNPPAPEFLDLCDRMGFLVMLESFDTWTVAKKYAEKGYNLHFKKWWKRDWQDTLLRDRNHPSIVLWSIGNEINGKFGVRNTDSPLDDLAGQLELAHQLDPTRPVTQALVNPRGRGQIPSITDLFDVAGANYRPLDLPLIAQDGKPVIGTEEAHDVNHWAAYRNHPSLSGCFLWTGVDYIGETQWPDVICKLGSSGFGLLEIGEAIRPRGYQRQSWWATKPMVSMARYASRDSSDDGSGELLRDWTPRNPEKYDKAVVEVYSNADEVELLLNGKSLGTEKVRPSGTPQRWLVPFVPGTLNAVAKKADKIVATDEWTTAGVPARISLSSDRPELRNVFDDVAHVTATIVDAKGVVCPNAEKLLKFEVTGPGKVIGVASGARESHQPFTATERQDYHGTCVGIVRSTAPSGEMTVTVSAPGLSAASVKIKMAHGVAP